MKTTAILITTALATGCGSNPGSPANQTPSSASHASSSGSTASTSAHGSGVSSSSATSALGSSTRSDPRSSSSSSDAGTTTASFRFGPYKDTGTNMNWNTNVISTNVSGTAKSLAADLPSPDKTTVTLAFATGECGSENWAGIAGDAMATANVSVLTSAGVDYIVSTGGAAGSFTCATDTGFATFLGRWASAHLVGVDFDIEAGQTSAVVGALVSRIKAAHATSPSLRFSLTLGTLGDNDGAATAHSLGASAGDSLNTYGDDSIAAVKTTLGFDGTPATWPAYLTVNLMTMDYGGASSGVCVVSSGTCQMGQSAIQAAYNLHDKWGVPYASIELTPMIGQNDASDEHFLLTDADTVAAFVKSQGLAGVHYWSYDRDADCAAGSASSTCSSMGAAYAGPHGFLSRFLAGGL
jgi:hypothetical protein